MRAKEVPGWTPEFTEDEEEDDVLVEDNHGGIYSDQEINNCNDVSDVKEMWVVQRRLMMVEGDDNSFVHTVGGKENSGLVNKRSDSMGSCRLKKSGMLRMGGSILSLIEEVVKVGQTMGYNMDGCVNDIAEIIKSQGDDSIGNWGGILCMWDPNSFCKSSFTRSDYFVIIRGLWLKSGIKLMIVVVYAPQEASEKRLNEVHLGDSAFTWCHKSATKMSALAKLKEDLRMFDEAIDKGNSPVEMVHKRLETLNKIQQVNNTHMSKVAQKAKIKWVVEEMKTRTFFMVC
nr:RNA-directed DNA polymerase, eukaryota [Tanacetum cinerariifolium]